MKYSSKMSNKFVGKLCTVLTCPVAKGGITDQQFSEFFMGIVEAIDEDGIYTTHCATGCSNFYQWVHVVGIMEEQVIRETDPNYPKILEELKSDKAAPSQPFVDIAEMSNLVQGAKMLRKS